MPPTSTFNQLFFKQLYCIKKYTLTHSEVFTLKQILSLYFKIIYRIVQKILIIDVNQIIFKKYFYSYPKSE